MALEDLRLHGKSTIEDAVNEIPQRGKQQLAQSITVLLTTDPQGWPRVLKVSAEAFESSFSADSRDLAKEIEVPAADAKHVVNGATFFAAMLSAHPECQPQQFISALLENKILIKEQEALALKLAELVIAGRDELTEEFERSALGNVVLPSLRRLETSVDIRLLSTENITTAIPVVLLMLDTDAEGQVLWCQMSKHELKSMIVKLNNAMEKVEFAEKWISTKSTSIEE